MLDKQQNKHRNYPHSFKSGTSDKALTSLLSPLFPLLPVRFPYLRSGRAALSKA